MTENSIVNELKMLKQKKMITIIYHNKESLIYCDKILEVDNGIVKLKER